MRIISFSSAATPSLWTLRVQALAPWMSLIRQSLERLLGHSIRQAAQGSTDTPVQDPWVA